MPTSPSANTYASTLVIAERASDFILGKASAGVARREEAPRPREVELVA